MFTGNKQQRKVEDVFIGMDGCPVARERLEDPGMKGRTRPGRLFTWDEIRAAAHYDLVSPGGQPFRCLLPVQVPRDPSVVRREDVPGPLREASEVAWAKLNEVRGRMAAALEKRTQAEAALHDATGRGHKGDYNRAVAGGMKAEEEYRAVELEEAVPRKAAADAEERIRRWMVDEGLYRSGAVPRPEPSAGIF